MIYAKAYYWIINPEDFPSPCRIIFFEDLHRAGPESAPSAETICFPDKPASWAARMGSIQRTDGASDASPGPVGHKSNSTWPEGRWKGKRVAVTGFRPVDFAAWTFQRRPPVIGEINHANGVPQFPRGKNRRAESLIS
jgi:hypothetical protein